MLTHTFQHVSGIMPFMENYLWQRGILSWDDYLCVKKPPFLSMTFHERVKNDVRNSQEALEVGDLKYFTARLPRNLFWRLFESFQKESAYFDIEATGLDIDWDSITVIGIYQGFHARSYYHSSNLEAAIDLLQSSPLWITFNGSSFDVPFLRESYGLKPSALHLDLRILYESLGIHGDLKALEELIGYKREKPLNYLNGATAVMLWKQYVAGNADALNLLLRYNMEDVVNLENLTIHVYNMLLEKTPFFKEKLPQKPKPILSNDWNRDLALQVTDAMRRKSGNGDMSNFYYG